MKIKTINKISAFLVALIAITIAIDFIILQGGFFVGKVSAAELARFRPAHNAICRRINTLKIIYKPLHPISP